MTKPVADREAELLRQQDVLARFGELALRSQDLIEILQEACRLVGEALETDCSKVMELQADGTTLLVKAGVGWPDGVVGRVTVEAKLGSSEGYALRTGQAVISTDIDAETRFEYADFIKDAGVRALVNVIIIGSDNEASPYGILQVDSCRPRSFTEQDTKFLRSYANLIAAAVNRLRIANELQRGTGRLREIMDRQDAALKTGLIGFFDWNIASDLVTGDQQFADFYGVDPEALAGGLSSYDLTELIHPDDRRSTDLNVQQALASCSDYSKELRLLHANGTTRWVLVRGHCYEQENGTPLRYTGVAVDVTAVKSVEAALRDSEKRFQQFGSASSDALWIRDADTLQFEYVSPAFESIYGVSRGEFLDGDDLGRWLDMIAPENRAQVREDMARVRAGENVTHEFEIQRASDGERRWVKDTVFPLFDRSDRVQRIGGIAHDVTEERATAGRMQVLMAELQHRTRNLIAVVRSLSGKTLAGSSSLGDFRDRFAARLEALSRVNSLLSRLEDGHRITFDALIRAELSAHGAVEDDGLRTQVILDGPVGVRLRSSTVQTFALALHELATNAVKYGALSSPKGQLRVRWRTGPDAHGQRRLRVEWEEHGVTMPPEADATLKKGYGRELIEQALPFQLKATTRYELSPDGVRCTIDLPITPRQDGEHEPELPLPPFWTPHPPGRG